MKYRKQKPTEPGFYYSGRGEFRTIVKIIKDRDGMKLVRFGSKEKFPLNMIVDEMEFCGPIQIPKGD